LEFRNAKKSMSHRVTSARVKLLVHCNALYVHVPKGDVTSDLSLLGTMNALKSQLSDVNRKL
jgi:hypothetical protein